jgi:hypothetical protein
MKILRSILAVIVGSIVAMVAVGIVQAIGHAVYPPPEEMKDADAFEKLMADPEAMKKVMDLISWQVGAFLGGAAAALVAGYGRCLQAGIIGVFILLASVVMMMMIPHPDWMKVAGLLLPLPMSLLGGKIVSLLLPPPPAHQPQLPVDQA